MRSSVLPLDTGYILQPQWSLHTLSTENHLIFRYI